MGSIVEVTNTIKLLEEYKDAITPCRNDIIQALKATNKSLDDVNVVLSALKKWRAIEEKRIADEKRKK